MTFRIKSLTAKNFMSIGNVTQSIDFDRKDLTLVLGQNMDLGGDDAGARNGTGKTTIVNALSYALYGQALTNIKKENLINKTNSKGMIVTVDFEINNNNYRIERGRKPNILRFYANGEIKEDDENNDDAQGDSRETQKVIEQLLNMSHDMFKHVLALNTYNEPFLSMRANDQREIIEQLLGITQLSAKSERLKELIRITKDSITEEEYRIKAVQDTNKKIQEQIVSLERRQRLWLSKKDEDINKLVASLENLKDIDIDSEINAHKELESYYQKKQKIDRLKKEKIDLTNRYERESQQLVKIKKDLDSTLEHKCYACGNKLHDDAHDKILSTKQTAVAESEEQLNIFKTSITNLDTQLEELGLLGISPRVFYDTLEQAMEHRNSIDKLSSQLENKLLEQDPYNEQISDMRVSAVEEVSWDHMNELTRIKEHQDFLLKLLTNKDSFIRKTIIDQNLSYLNSRLSYYLQQIGLPHTVRFQSDLTVSIEELGRDLDFFNLSRGEMTRLILSLSLSFRDVFEGLFQPINLLFIDEMLDNGLDQSGLESVVSILKKMTRERNKSVWIVSHREELKSRVNNVMAVIKENGYTSYNEGADELSQI